MTTITLNPTATIHNTTATDWRTGEVYAVVTGAPGMKIPTRTTLVLDAGKIAKAQADAAHVMSLFNR